MTARSLFLNAPVHRAVGAGEVIYAEGDFDDHMFGIVTGQVELRKGDVTVAVLGPDDVFGERALVDGQPRSLSAVATAETTLAEIDRKLFLFLVEKSPTFALDIMGALAQRLTAYDDWVADRPSGEPGT